MNVTWLERNWPACVDFLRAFLMSSSIFVLSLISSCWVFTSRSFCLSASALRACEHNRQIKDEFSLCAFLRTVYLLSNFHSQFNWITDVPPYWLTWLCNPKFIWLVFFHFGSCNDLTGIRSFCQGWFVYSSHTSTADNCALCLKVMHEGQGHVIIIELGKPPGPGNGLLIWELVWSFNKAWEGFLKF